MKRTIAFVGLILGLVPASAAVAANEDDRAKRALEQVRVRLAPGHVAAISEKFESTLYYKVCVQRKSKPAKRRCWQSTTNARGKDRVSVAGFVAKHGKGRYVVVWTGGGLEFGRRRFRA